MVGTGVVPIVGDSVSGAVGGSVADCGSSPSKPPTSKVMSVPVCDSTLIQ